MQLLPLHRTIVANEPTAQISPLLRFAVTFSRRPSVCLVIVVHDPPITATERGRWVGRWQNGWRTEAMRGTYVASWRLEAGEWRIASEVFVPG